MRRGKQRGKKRSQKTRKITGRARLEEGGEKEEGRSNVRREERRG